MKLLRRKSQPDEVLKIEYKIQKEDSVLHIEFTTLRFGESYTGKLDFDMKNYAGRVMEIDLIEDDNPTTISIVPVFENYNFGGSLPNRSLGSGDIRVLRIAIEEDGENGVIQLTKPHPAIDGFEDIVMDTKSKTMPAYLAEHSEAARRLIERVKRKTSLLTEIDFRDSLSYLEAQVDCLVEILLKGDKSEEALEVLKRARNYSVLNSKSKDKLLGEIEHKENVRAKQRKYYAAVESSES